MNGMPCSVLRSLWRSRRRLVRNTCSLALMAGLGGAPLVAQQISVAGKPATAPQKRVVGYFTQWGTYSDFNVKNLVTSGSAGVLTQIDYAFAGLENGQCVSLDTYADYEKVLPASMTVDGVADSGAPGALAGNFHQLQELKKRYPKLKVVMSVGGGSANPNDFSVAAEPAHRKLFVKSCIDLFVKGNLAPGMTEPGIFDGFDIDWEYPLSATDTKNFTGLLAEFRKQMDAVRPGMTLSIASSAGSWAYQYIDFPAVQRSIDFFGLMAYDFDGPWENTTGLVAPLSQAIGDPDPANNASAAVAGYLAAGVKPEKIVLGVPFYAYDWTGVPNVDHGLWQAGTPVGSAEYNQIVPMEKNFEHYRDPITLAPWLYDGTTFWTYDDPLSLAYKMLYADRMKLGGAMAWDLSGDMPDGVLLKTVAVTLNGKK